MAFHFGGYICGCYFIHHNQRTYLPQVELLSHTKINPVCFSTTLTQIFQNPSATPLENVTYAFPLYDSVTVQSFTITCGEKVLEGIVKQKDVARETYQAAVDRNETAGLLEALPSGIFGLSVGNVPAWTNVKVVITYSGELKHDAEIDGLRYNLPTAIAPRYGNYPAAVMTSSAHASQGMRIVVDVDMAQSRIRKVMSPSHPIAIELGQISQSTDCENVRPSADLSLASATLTLGTAELDNDFVLQILVEDIGNPRAFIESHPDLPNQRAIMATLVPKFTLPSANPEIVFIADQSGSMGGTNNDSLVAALKILLKSLPFGVRFNVCAFGSTHRFLWDRSQAYNESNVNLAIQFAESFQAHMGGTEMFEPIKAAFENHLPDLPLDIMLLTDGQVWGEQPIFDFIRNQIRDEKVDARVFSLGIGSGVSHTLVEGIARAGNGFSQFVTDGEVMDRKIIRMLKSALFAHTKDYQMELHYGDSNTGDDMDGDFELVDRVRDCLTIEDGDSNALDEPHTQLNQPISFFDTSADAGENDRPTDRVETQRFAHLPSVKLPSIIQAPCYIPPLHAFSRSTLYFLLGPEAPQRHITSITLRAKSNQAPLELNIPVQPMKSAGTVVHALAARKAIQDLEDNAGWLHNTTIRSKTGTEDIPLKEKHRSRFDEIVECEAVRLGEKFHVASKWTSFVAIEKASGIENATRSAHTDAPFSGTTMSQRRGQAGNFRSLFSNQQPGSMASYGAPLSTAGGLFGSSRPQVALPSPFALSRNMAPQATSTVALRSAPTHTQAAVPSPSALFGNLAPQATSPVAFGSASFGAQAAAPSPGAGFGSSSFSSFGMASRATPAVAFESVSSDTQAAASSLSVGFGQKRYGDTSSQATAEAQDTRHTLRFKEGESAALDMHGVINRQQFTGAWQWDAALLQGLGLHPESINKHALGNDDELAATALAVAWLQTKHAEQQSVWEFIVAKASTWLQGSLPSSYRLEDVIESASAYFRHG